MVAFFTHAGMLLLLLLWANLVLTCLKTVFILNFVKFSDNQGFTTVAYIWQWCLECWQTLVFLLVLVWRNVPLVGDFLRNVGSTRGESSVINSWSKTRPWSSKAKIPWRQRLVLSIQKTHQIAGWRHCHHLQAYGKLTVAATQSGLAPWCWEEYGRVFFFFFKLKHSVYIFELQLYDDIIYIILHSTY